MKRSIFGSWLVVGMLVSGATFAKSAEKICDTDKDGKISDTELAASKCQKKLVRTLSLYERELAGWAASGAKALVDAAAETASGQSKAERRAVVLKCMVESASTAYEVWKKGNFAAIPESEAFSACYKALPASTLEKLSAKIDSRVKKVESARSELEALVGEAGGTSALEAVLLRVEAKQARENAWARTAYGVFQTGYALGKAIKAKNPKNVIVATIAFYGEVKTDVKDLKSARSVACDAAIRAEELDPSFWKSGFVKRCQKLGKINDPIDAQ
jgi:hypothetical protein